MGSSSVSNKAGIKPKVVECFYPEAEPEALVAVSVVFAVAGSACARPGTAQGLPSLAPLTALPVQPVSRSRSTHSLRARPRAAHWQTPRTLHTHI